ncbi:MAG: LAGLIDADG family homing endonuclease [Thermoplasmata archaeon]
MLSYSTEDLILHWEEFLDEGDFAGRITAIVDAYPQERSLYVEYSDVERFDSDLAIYLLRHPQNAIYAAEQAARQFIPPTEEAEIHFRVRGIPRDMRVEIRDLRAKHLGRLIAVEGLVRKATEVRPRLVEAVFQCVRCGAIIKEVQEGMDFKEPLECYQDQGGCGRTPGSTKFKLLDEGSRFVDTQKIEVQEPPEGLRGGEQPQRLVAYVEDDLTGEVFPGDRIVLNGVLRSMQRGRFRAKSTLFDIFSDVVSVEMEKVEYEQIEITPDDAKRIEEEAASGDVIRKIVGSIAPSIYGLEVEKEALALQLFGGVTKHLPDGRRIRGDSHILLVGDPGTGKSELLEYMVRLSPRGIYASGKASTAAGLTASATRDEFGEGRWTLEAGALVLADKGLACLHPESEVLVDGMPVPVGTLFDANRSEKALSEGQEVEIAPLQRETVSLNPHTLTVQNAKATLVTRRVYQGPLIRVTFDSGFQLRLTPDHLVLDGETLRWREARQLQKGDRVVAMQKLPERVDPVYILDLIPADWILRLSRGEKRELCREVFQRFSDQGIDKASCVIRHFLSGGNTIPLAEFRQLLRRLGLYEIWRRRPLPYGRKKGAERLRVSKLTADLAYVLGFIYGDGHVKVTKKSSSLSAAQSAVHLACIRRFLLAARASTSRTWGMSERHFDGVVQGIRTSSRDCQMQMGSNLIAYLYEWVTGDDLVNLLALDDESLRGFIAGVMDSDGCISVRTNKKGALEYQNVVIEFAISSRRLSNMRFMYALRRLDVFSRLRRHPDAYGVQVTSRSDANRLLNAISPFSERCKEIPRLKRKISARHEEVPAIPVAEILKDVRPRPTWLLPKMVQSSFYEFRNLTRRPYKEGLNRLLRPLALWTTPDQQRRLEGLASQDYALDQVAEVRREPYDGYVYDLRVPEWENFLCDGLCVHNCIDEIEKMSEHDRSSIHTAMEQQTVHVAKAGITATLQTRCAILAAANPTLGRFDDQKYISEQINLPSTLLSRFDSIFPIMDRPHAQHDKAMAEHILKGHLVGEQLLQGTDSASQGQFEVDEAFLPYFDPTFLRKYVAYAKRIYPVMTPETMQIIEDKYLEIRKQGEVEGGAVPITPRQLEAFIRIAEASARARLSPEVMEEDANRAVRIVEYWLQKVTGIEGGFDIDIVATGLSQSQRTQMIALRDIIADLSARDGVADLKDILEQAEEKGIPASRVEAWLKRWSQEGEVYSPAAKKWKLVSRF